MKYILVYLICFFIFCTWLHYEQRKSQRKAKKSSDEFWLREEEANRTRKKDISHLPLLSVAEAEIPCHENASDTARQNITQIYHMLKNPMMDLSEYSNTDLKLAYGVGNFKTLSEYDENFSQFLLALTDLARTYAKENLFEAARDTYLLALKYGSKKASDYTELAAVYLQMDQPEEVSALIRSVRDGSHPRKETILQNLQQVLASYQ
jgi:uncharacterized protein HemY